MPTTPTLWKSLTQVNATDSGPDGVSQADGQIVALKDGGYVVVWSDDSGTYNSYGIAVVGQRYDSAGDKVGGEVHLTSGFPGNSFAPSVTLLGEGTLAVAFVNDFNGSNDVYVRIFKPSLTIGRTDFIDTGATQTLDPSITALADGGYAVSYTVDGAQIAGRIVSISGFQGPQFGVSGQTHSELATLSNGNFVVVHQGDSSINLEVLTPTGGAAGFADVSLDGSDPNVAALRDGGYVVVWTDPASSSGDIRTSIYSNDNVLIANQLLVNTSTAGAQNEASVVGLADGGFLVTWENDPAGIVLGRMSDRVLAQRFDAVGNKIGDEFTVKKGISVDSPDVVLLSDGRIAFAVGDVSTGDPDVMTSIWDPRGDIFILNPNALGLLDGTNLIIGSAVGGNPGADWHLFA
jgi:hypothetical protein